MTFKITIEKTEIAEKVLPKKWEKAGQEQKQGSFDEKVYYADVYAYTPEVTTKQDVTIKVLEQTVETLDLASVIKAINGL